MAKQTKPEKIIAKLRETGLRLSQGESVLKGGQADRCERRGLLSMAKGVGRLQVFSAGRLGDK